MATRFQDGGLEVTDEELVTPRGRWPLAAFEAVRVERLPDRPQHWIRFVVTGAAALGGALFFATRLVDALAFGAVGVALLLLGWKARATKPVHVCVLRLAGQDVRVAQSADPARLERIADAVRKVCR